MGLLCLLAIAPSTAPVQLSYVYSDSMEPTVDRFDGYVLVPAGEVNAGDIVTFRSSERDSYVTHRVVGRSDRGFITKGDNNPSTDQTAGVPHVRRDDIVGGLLTVRGAPVLIPGFGHAVRFVRSHRVLVAALFGTGLAVGLLRGPRASRPSRSVPRVRDVLWPVFAIAVVSAICLQFFGGQTERFTYVAVASGADGPNRLAVGEASSESVVVTRSTFPMTESVISADGMTITNRTRNDSAIAVTMSIPPPERTGVVRTGVRVHPYITVLPLPLVRRLHGIHPLLAGSATAVTAMLPLAIVALLAIDGKRPLRSVEGRRMRALRRRWREL